MLKIGVTGGIGSGKTLICTAFSKMGIAVYNADYEAKQLISNNSYVKNKLIHTFGHKIYKPEGGIDRKKLASIIFNNKKALETINAIVHPAVEKHFKDWADTKTDKKFVIKEAAILFESGSYKELDKIITVTAPEEVRIERVMNRDKIGRQSVEARIKNQMPDKQKIELSDYVIYNDGKQMLLPQIIEIYNLIKLCIVKSEK